VIQDAIASAGNRTPAWLTANTAQFSGKVIAAPRREEVDSDVSEQIIIEFYSR
jgi:small subunit ribosomal protein S4